MVRKDFSWSHKIFKILYNFLFVPVFYGPIHYIYESLGHFRDLGTTSMGPNMQNIVHGRTLWVLVLVSLINGRGVVITCSDLRRTFMSNNSISL